jgi:thioredoxin 2
MILECPSCKTKNRVPAARLGATARCGECKTPLGLPTKTSPVTSAAEFDELVQGSPLPVLIDFWAPWCGPCNLVSRELERVAVQQSGRVIVAKVNTDALPDVAGRFNIQAIPTMILFSGGRESKRLQGAMQAAAIVSELAL